MPELESKAHSLRGALPRPARLEHSLHIPIVGVSPCLPSEAPFAHIRFAARLPNPDQLKLSVAFIIPETLASDPWFSHPGYNHISRPMSPSSFSLSATAHLSHLRSVPSTHFPKGLEARSLTFVLF
ncbi:hypothetical protein B0H19DRAFT_647846 [Mycena capillaripes]|nr:hypothetical protein B0H19DRAFT_647846 [Mycena capillaripes]